MSHLERIARACRFGIVAVLWALGGPGVATGTGIYFGQVTGVSGAGAFEDVDVVLSGSDLLTRASPDAQGRFAFYELPRGHYVVQVRKRGYRSSPARSFSVGAGGQVSATSAENDFQLEQLDPNTFVFHWEEDESTAGFDYASRVNRPVAIEFLEDETEAADGSSASRLLRDYNVLLVNGEDGSWTHEHAYRLLRTMQAIPQRIRDPYRVQSLSPSRWFLAPEQLLNDIEMSLDVATGFATVRISVAAFVHSNPKVARIEGKRGTYYSQRLHHAAVRFVTDNGRDIDACERILRDRFGVTTKVIDHISYEVLTERTTQEPGSRFQNFHPEELVQIINMFEEIPSGMRTVPGLQYLVRRLDGMPNPTTSAPAVAHVSAGYIEFMDQAFSGPSLEFTHRLIIHEKAHFFWSHLFNDGLKQEWIRLGGWYRNQDDVDGWSTSKQTEFVSAYAHQRNPDEDMAESISYFIINPDKLRSRSIAKYEFIRDRIMQGNIYISLIRRDLTFEVYNLYPDYVFPGKIRRVDIEVRGGPEEDKTVSIEIALHALDNVLEGAVHAFTRIFSEQGTYKDLYLYPVGLPRGTPGTVLAGSLTLSKHAAGGYWTPDQISITDEHRNERFESPEDFGWSLLIDSPLEDVTPPEYVRNSMMISTSTEIMEGREVQVIDATWKVMEEESGLTECYGYLDIVIQGIHGYWFGIKSREHFDPQDNLCRARKIIPNYMPSSVYTVVYIWMKDRAGNNAGVYFGDPNHGLRQNDSIIDETAVQIEVVTDNPDIAAPELDLNKINIRAMPTHPENPNGETLVTLEFSVRDNISGVQIGWLRLRDPQGTSHHFYIYSNFARHLLFAEEDPSLWSRHTWTVVLPVGSPPGTWGVAEMSFEDRAGNVSRYDFTETVHFELQ